MNPELDKILKSMQANEIFIEYAIVYKNDKGTRLKVGVIISKTDYNVVCRVIKAVNQADEVQLTIISK